MALSVVGPGAMGVEIQRVQQYAAGPDDIVAEQLFVAAQQIDFSGTAHDDVFFLAGQSVSVTGHVLNDLWAFARTMHIGGSIGDHARLLGTTITFAGTVDNSLSAAGSTVHVMTNAVVRGSLNLLGENVIVEGEVKGITRILAQHITLAGRMHDDVSIVADDIVVLGGTLIEGNLTYTAGRELILDKNVSLKGELIRKEPTRPAPDATRRSLLQSLILQAMLCFSALLAGTAFIGLFPQATGAAVRTIRASPWKCVFAGVGGFCLIPLLSIMLLFTLVGIPLAILLLLGYAILLYISQIPVALALGSALLRRRGPQSFGQIALALITGLVFLYILSLLPIIGFTVLLAVLLIGLGASLIAVLGQQQGATAPPPLPGASETSAPSSV
jgi:hypothetical protein